MFNNHLSKNQKCVCMCVYPYISLLYIFDTKDT